MRRQVLIPVIAAQAVGLLALGGWFVTQATDRPAQPAEQGVVLDVAASSTTAASSTPEITATSVVALPSTTAPAAVEVEAQPAPRVQQQEQPAPRQAQQVQEPVAEPEPPAAPVETVVTTTPAAAATNAPTMPWCFREGHGWYSGSGEGCTPNSEFFVEYR